MVIRFLLLIVLILSGAASQAATITATLDRNPVAVHESFTVTFDAQGDLEDDPDFSPLETYFDILNQSQSNRLQIINGHMDSTKQWALTLMARNPGTYTLPAIEFGKDRSNTLELEVRDAPAAAGATPDSAIFLEAELSPESSYIQAQLVYTVRLLRSVNLRSGSLSEPSISGIEAMVEKLGEDRTFETQRNGVRYVVVERSYAIFPQQSGTLVVEPTVFQGQIVIRSNRFLFDENVQTKRLASQAFSIAVKPKPAQAPSPWLPARALRLQEEWTEDPPQFRVGEPVTRTLTLGADGIAATQLPSLARTLPDGLKQYPDQPVVQDDKRATGLFGIRQEKIAIMPSRPGRYELPAIEVPWWNIETGEQEIARIPARTIEVAAASGTPAMSTPLLQEPFDARAVTPPMQTVERISASFWPWLSGALALGWLITTLLWWRQRRPLAKQLTPRQPAADLTAVENACRQNDPHACKVALIDWARSQWPQQPPTSLGAIANRVDNPFGTAIGKLNRVLYAREGGDWNGAELVFAVQQWRQQSQTSGTRMASPIAPLRLYLP